jgi:ABC-2 type transport system permease protein
VTAPAGSQLGSTGTGTFAPSPGAAPMHRMVLTQARLELSLMLRNGEQFLLLAVIPVLLLSLFATVDLVEVPGRPVDFVTPGILALAVLSTAFTGQAIGTGFDRRYGVLKRLAATPLSRRGFVLAKTLAVLAIEAAQVTVLSLLALALGWSPRGSVLPVLVLLLLGTAVFSGLGLLLAGTLKAEVTLALANLVHLLLLAAGAVVVPLDRFPAVLADVLAYTPMTALSEGLRDVLVDGSALPWGPVAVLAGWAVVAVAAASRLFRWE